MFVCEGTIKSGDLLAEQVDDFLSLEFVSKHLNPDPTVKY